MPIWVFTLVRSWCSAWTDLSVQLRPKPAADVLVPYVHSFRKANSIAEEWRRHQKWMMFYLTLAERFVPHPECTEAALRHTLEKFHAKVSDDAVKEIMAKYQHLRAFPDVPEGLRRLREQGHVLRIVGNPARWMLEEGSEYAGIRQYFHQIVSSTDQTKTCKPSPKTFQLGLSLAGVPKEQVLWVTGHFWEVIGADGQGIKTAWINRMNVPHDYIGVTPTYQTRTLVELADLLEKKKEQV